VQVETLAPPVFGKETKESGDVSLGGVNEAFTLHMTQRTLQIPARVASQFASSLMTTRPIDQLAAAFIPVALAPGAIEASAPQLAPTSLPAPILYDKHGRAITDLRISITDRCNYKCVYCRTGNVGAQFPELPLSDYIRMARLFVELGIEKIRLTGGEPLLRRDVVQLVRELSKLRTHQGRAPEIAITTNGHLLAELVEPLKDAGLARVTVSMDAVEPVRFSRITRVPGGFEQVLAGMRVAKRAGLEPVKVNCVLLRGFNDDQIIEFGKFARDEGVVVRFIEFMPLEEDRVWTPEIVVRLDEILATMATYRPLVEIERGRSETARRFVFDDGIGEMGIIAPVSNPFCGHCSRVRLTSDGKIRTCLFSTFEHDMAGRMRQGFTDDALRSYILGVVHEKEARHHIGEPGFLPASRTMVHIGG
jgi:GTP 3',8-cyclase